MPVLSLTIYVIGSGSPLNPVSGVNVTSPGFGPVFHVPCPGTVTLSVGVLGFFGSINCTVDGSTSLPPLPSLLVTFCVTGCPGTPIATSGTDVDG